MVIERNPDLAQLDSVHMRAALYFSRKRRIARINAAAVPAADKQYWRVLGTDSQTANSYTVTELEFRETVSGANLSTIGQAIAGSVHTVEFDETKAFDNDTNTNWRNKQDGDLTDDWIGQDFGADQAVAEIALISGIGETLAMLGFEVAYSSDQVSWTFVMEVLGQPNWADGETRLYELTSPAVPTNTHTPVITGDTVIPSTHTVSTGGWESNPASTGFSYQWKLDGTNVGTDQNTFTTDTPDDGKALTCDVTITNSEGSTTVTSNSVVVALPTAATPVMTFTSNTELLSPNDLVLTYPTGIISGDLLLLVVSTDTVGGLSKWDTPAGYVLETFVGDAVSDVVTNIYSRTADGTETGTIAVVPNTAISFDKGGFCIRLTEGSNGVTLGVIGAAATILATSVDAPSITTLIAKSLIMAFGSLDGDDYVSFSFTAGYTKEDEIGIGGTGGLGLTFATRELVAASATGVCNIAQNASDGMMGFQISVHSTP